MAESDADDLCLLVKPTAAGIAAALSERLKRKTIYTAIGPVLICVNPFEWLPIYTSKVVNAYNDKPRLDNPPHVYAVAEAAYRAMIADEEPQSIMISGESGAGKTEASKHIQHYIAEISKGGEAVQAVKRVFLESNPLLEAFGNAKTLRNDNSSRFGKFFELEFDRLGRPRGGCVTTYLLEKSRICRPGKGQRSFHVFYQLLCGAPPEMRSKIKLPAIEKCRYISSGGAATTVDGVSDADELQKTSSAMVAIGCKSSQCSAIVCVVAAVLALGNITFNASGDGSVPANAAALDTCASLLGLEDSTALGAAFVFRQIETRGPGGSMERITVPQNPTQAGYARDAVAKTLFTKLFDYIVARVNHALKRAQAAAVGEGAGDGLQDDESGMSIGVLDIYGFEIFQHNGFEQMCINFVNEKLQQVFIEFTLRAEQDEYAAEGIAWSPIPFFNNKIVCDLIEGRALTPGVLPILDDACRTCHSQGGDAVDAHFLDTLSRTHGSHAHLSRSDKSFVVVHYAGDVCYTTGGFGDANNDALRPELFLATLGAAKDKLVRTLCPVEEHAPPAPAEPSRGRKSPMPVTAGARIRTQCASLVEALAECAPHYIRCIKSNDKKQACTMDSSRCQHQVKYLGLEENVKVRRAGYAYRAEFYRFAERFKLLSRETWPAPHSGTDRSAAKAVIKAARKRLPELKQEVQMGKTKIFLRHPETLLALDELRDVKKGELAMAIQQRWRAYVGVRVQLKQRLEMHKLYAEAGKRRRAESLFRPYDRKYVSPRGSAAALADARRILHHYGETLKDVVFSDWVVHATTGTLAVPQHGKNAKPSTAAKKGTAPGPLARKRLLLVTRGAIYLVAKGVVGDSEGGVEVDIVADETDERPASAPEAGAAKGPKARVEVERLLAAGEGEWKHTPKVYGLRRRVAHRIISAAALSLSADATLVLKVRQDALPAKPDKSAWVPDKEASKCALTGLGFGLMMRRHHCRLSGRILCDEACGYLPCLPDLSWGERVRVARSLVGTASIEPLEDIVILTDKKTELLNVLMNLAREDESRPPLKSTFTEDIHLGLAGPSLTRLPFPRLAFATDDKLRAPKPPTADSGRGALVIAVPTGLDHGVVDEIAKRAKRRRKQAEKRRLAERERLAALAAERAEERERVRRSHAVERKARKQAERVARKASMGIGTAQNATRVFAKGTGKQRAERPPPVEADAPQAGLAAILAKRIAAADP